MATMMNEQQRAAHMRLVLDGLYNQKQSLEAEVREQKGKLERSLRLANKDPVWGRKEYADAAAERIEKLLVQLRAVNSRIAAGA